MNDALGILSFSFDLQKRNRQGTYNIITLSAFFVSHPTLKNASLYNYANKLSKHFSLRSVILHNSLVIKPKYLGRLCCFNLSSFQ